MKIEIVKSGINGEGIGFINKQPVFVDGLLPNEEADIRIVERNKTYSIAEVIKITKQSEKRCKPRCKVQRKCGACPMMIALYDEQCRLKVDNLKQSLIKYAQVNPKYIQPIIQSNLKHGYRNMCKVPFGMVENKLVTGMYQPNSNYFNEIEFCSIHDPLIEEIRKSILKILNEHRCKSYDYKIKKGYRSLVIRVLENQAQVTLVTGEEIISDVVLDRILHIKGVASLWQSVHTQKKGVDIFGNQMIHLGGTKTLDFEFMNLQMQLSPRSFFQLNTQQAAKLYQVIKDSIEGHRKTIVEAYSGIGGISMMLADKADQVIGIESIKDAVINANNIAKLNKLSNVSFVCEDAAYKLEYYAKQGNVDTLVVDPPRSGLDDHMIDVLLKSKIQEIIYVSCNPATLGKNLASLKQRYTVQKVTPLDMFPHSAHIESVVRLSRIKKTIK